MTTSNHSLGATVPVAGIRPGMTVILACACGLMAASIYLAQPLVLPISAALGLPTWASSTVVAAGQIGFCVGLRYLVPLGDLVENRRLVLTTMALLALAICAAGLAPGAASFLLWAVVMGCCQTAVQMLLPLAAHMSAPEQRGKVLGQITGGLLTGVLLARPAASFVAGHFGWRMVYLLDAAIVLLLAGWLAFKLPARRPSSDLGYRALLRSTWSLLRTHEDLGRLSLAQSCLFAAFSLFWTAVPILLRQRFHLDDSAIALFAFAGAAGAFVAPWAGSLADRGKAALVRSVALAGALLGFFAAGAGGQIWLLLIGALLIDAGVQACHVTAQRAILALDAAARSRLNSVYMTIFFFGGAVGSAVAAPLDALGWAWVCSAGVLLVGAGIMASARRLPWTRARMPEGARRHG